MKKIYASKEDFEKKNPYLVVCSNKESYWILDSCNRKKVAEKVCEVYDQYYGNSCVVITRKRAEHVMRFKDLISYSG